MRRPHKQLIIISSLDSIKLVQHLASLFRIFMHCTRLIQRQAIPKRSVRIPKQMITVRRISRKDHPPALASLILRPNQGNQVPLTMPRGSYQPEAPISKEIVPVVERSNLLPVVWVPGRVWKLLDRELRGLGIPDPAVKVAVCMLGPGFCRQAESSRAAEEFGLREVRGYWVDVVPVGVT